MSARRPVSYLLRAIVVNTLILVGFIQAQRAGRLNGIIIAVYVFIAVAANGLMYFGAHARRRLQDR